jgi:hypothetical protein
MLRRVADEKIGCMAIPALLGFLYFEPLLALPGRSRHN